VTSAYEPGYGYGGPVRSVGSLCRSLVRLGAEVTVFTTNANGVGPAQVDVPLDQPVIRSGIEVYYFRRQWPWSLYYSPGLRAACRARIGQFDLVHIAGLWAYPCLVAGTESLRQNVSYVISPRGMLMPWESRHKSWKKLPYFYLSEARRLRGSKGLHCTTQAERHALSAFGLETKGFVIPNGLDISEFDRLPARGALRVRLGIAQHERVLLFLGRLHRKKGIELTLLAFYRLAATSPGVHLVLVGGDEDGYAETIKAQAAEWGLRNRIHVTGELKGHDRLSAYADADAFILLSKSENFGMSVVEALACRLPVVISRDVGIVVDHDVDAVVQALQRVLSEGDHVARMRENGRRLAEKEFSEDAVGRQMLEAYHRILAGDGVS
jgi:glycosyltransferase involved in cell wall biosynthesis